MTSLGEVVISTVELLEAEARKLRTNLRGVVVSLVLIGVAGVLLLGGLGWLVAAGYMQLRVWLDPAPAAALVGLGSILLAGGGLWWARKS